MVFTGLLVLGVLSFLFLFQYDKTTGILKLFYIYDVEVRNKFGSVEGIPVLYCLGLRSTKRL